MGKIYIFWAAVKFNGKFMFFNQYTIKELVQLLV